MITGNYHIDVSLSLVNVGQIRLVQTKHALKITDCKYPLKVQHKTRLLSPVTALIAVCVPYLLLLNQNCGGHPLRWF